MGGAAPIAKRVSGRWFVGSLIVAHRGGALFLVLRRITLHRLVEEGDFPSIFSHERTEALCGSHLRT